MLEVFQALVSEGIENSQGEPGALVSVLAACVLILATVVAVLWVKLNSSEKKLDKANAYNFKMIAEVTELMTSVRSVLDEISHNHVKSTDQISVKISDHMNRIYTKLNEISNNISEMKGGGR